MNINEAYSIASQPEPLDEDAVDLICMCCDGMWMSSSRGIHRLGGTEITYNNYVGRGNSKLTDKGFVYYCPNGCNRRLQDIHSSNNFTPWEVWYCANLVVRMDDLERELKDVKKELNNYRYL